MAPAFKAKAAARVSDQKPAPRSFLTVADDIQQIAIGKMMAIGLYPDRVVLIHRPPGSTGGSAIGKLVLALTIRNLPNGHYDVRSALVWPNGQDHVNPAEATIDVANGINESVTLQYIFVPFSVPMSGEYKLRVSLNGFVFEESFEVFERDLTAAVQALTGVSVLPAAKRAQKRKSSPGAHVLDVRPKVSKPSRAKAVAKKK